jgi:hypothetical protein
LPYLIELPPSLKMRSVLLSSIAALAASSFAFVIPPSDTQQSSIGNSKKNDDDYNLEPNANFAFSGVTTFAQLPLVQCLMEIGPVDDILVLGFPFDTATSYRTGTRFGPNAIRQGSRAAVLAYVCLRGSIHVR